VVLVPRRAVAQPAVRQPEHAVKAEFIERFTVFTEWPGSALASRAPFVVCIAGDGPLRAALERVVSQRPIKQHPARVKHVDDSAALTECHLLYIAPNRDAGLAALLRRTAGRPILTVGDSTGWGARGVMVNLFVDSQSYVRFEINLDSANASGLKISAKLLRLARTIHGGK